MTAGRLGAYLALAMWEGGLGMAWFDNWQEGRLVPVVANSFLLVLVALALSAMRRTDRAAGRLTR